MAGMLASIRPVCLFAAALCAGPALADAAADLAARQAALSQPGVPPREKLDGARALSADYEAAGDLVKAARVLGLAVHGAGALRDQAALEEVTQRAEALCRRAADEECLGRALNNLAIADINAGRMEQALERLEAAVRHYHAANMAFDAVMVRVNAASVRHELGDDAGALADLDAVGPAIRETGNLARVWPWLLARAEVLLGLGRPRDALDTAREALALPDLGGTGPVMVDMRTEAHSLAGRALAQMGEGEAALANHRVALDRLKGSPSPMATYRANYSLAESLVRLGRAREALAAVEAAAPVAPRTKVTDQRRFYALASLVYAAAGRPEAALEAQRRAAEVQERLYQGNLSAALARAQAGVVVAEREAEARRLAERNEADRARAARELGWTRLISAVGLAGLLAAGVALLLWLRGRQERRRHAEVLAERKRIAGEVHDTLMQGLTGAVQQVHLARHALRTQGPGVDDALAAATEIAQRTLGEARTAVWDMREPEQAQRPMADRLRLAVQGLAAPTGPAVEVGVGADVGAVPPDLGTTLSRVAREAVSNAVRHGAPHRVAVTLERAGRALRLTVRDDGKGFTPVAGGGPGGHWGLVVMRERLERLGGTLTVSSAPGQGTTVVAEAPA